MVGLQPETVYIIGEVEHLMWCGMAPRDVCTAVRRTPSALEKVLRRAGKFDLANTFGSLRQKEGKKAA